MTEMMHINSPRNYGCIHNPSQTEIHHGCGESHGVPPLAEELFVVDGYWRVIVFMNAYPEKLQIFTDEPTPSDLQEAWSKLVGFKKRTVKKGKLWEAGNGLERRKWWLDFIKIHCMYTQNSQQKKIIEREKRGRKGSRENAELSKNQLKF